MNWTEEELANYNSKRGKIEPGIILKPVFKPPKIKESEIQRDIKKLLQTYKFHVIKIQQGALSEPGIPDLWCIGLNKSRETIQAWIEVKTAAGRLSAYQEDFRTAVDMRGGTVLIMRSIDDCMSWLRDVEVI